MKDKIESIYMMESFVNFLNENPKISSNDIKEFSPKLKFMKR